MPVFNYDGAYAKPGLYWGREPNSLCLETIALDSTGHREDKRAIDLGCGEGRDLIQFARCGYEAVGVDISLPGLRRGTQRVQRFCGKAFSGNTSRLGN